MKARGNVCCRGQRVQEAAARYETANSPGECHSDLSACGGDEDEERRVEKRASYPSLGSGYEVSHVVR